MRMVGPLNPRDSSALIVEDNPDDALLVARALETFGLRRVFAVETAEEALSFIASQPCDVVLVDYHLPRMNGLTLLERVQEAYPGTRVILVTGARDEHIAVSALKTGAVDYIPKDELLTSGLVRSMQTALRQTLDAGDRRRRAALAAADGTTARAREEAAWLLASLPHGAATPRDDELLDMVERFVRVLRQSVRLFPAPAVEEEEGFVRMALERGASPAALLAVYTAGLEALGADEQPPFNPALCLLRVLAAMVAEYQLERSLEQLGRGAA
jgi:CheY-like chemotaxis protein